MQQDVILETCADNISQVLRDLPKKTERIEWCDMSPLQKKIYSDALRRSRKTIFDMGENAADPPLPVDSEKPPKKKTKTTARAKDKMYLENSSNVLMDLRKAAAHPMLFRRLFTDEVLTSMARLLLKEPDFKKRGALFELVKEDMEVMTDAELQVFCATYKVLLAYLRFCIYSIRSSSACLSFVCRRTATSGQARSRS